MITIIKNNTIRSQNVSGVVREAFDTDKFREFIENIDSVVNDKDIFTVIKDGDTTVVGTVDKSDSGLEVDLMVKCFKSGGFFKTSARRILGSKAKRLFSDSSTLFMEGFNVAEPVCYLDLFKSIESCFVSLVLDDCKNFALIYDELINTSSDELARTIAIEMNRWHSKGVVHGDMKWSNIMLNVDGGTIKPYFIDLDQVSIKGTVSPSGVMDDLTRFYRYGLEMGRDDWVHNVFLPFYISFSSEEIKKSLNIDDIALRAMAEHKLKK